jgi:NADH-quinone oxidoreductase subunit K
MLTTLFLSTLFIIFALLIITFKPNLLFVLFALEIILLGININFVMASIVLDDFLGKYLTLILFSVAALDTSVGLILLLNYYGLHSVSRITTVIKG